MVVIGEKFQEIEVNTTHGKMKLPDQFRRKVVCIVSPSCGLYTCLYYRVLRDAETPRKVQRTQR